jgi:hypothetical protein
MKTPCSSTNGLRDTRWGAEAIVHLEKWIVHWFPVLRACAKCNAQAQLIPPRLYTPPEISSRPTVRLVCSRHKYLNSQVDTTSG